MSAEPTFAPAAMSGNGKLLELTRDKKTWVVRFISEPRTSPQPLWFSFELSDVGGCPVRLIWDTVDITLGGGSNLDTLRPVLRADDGDWRRVPDVEVVTTTDGRSQVVFEQAEPCERLGAAFCFPYGPDDLQATLHELPGAWDDSVIGLSREGREFRRLRQANVSGDGKRPGVYFMARQHAGETPGSWLMDGVMRFLAGDSDEARRWREEFDCWLAPFVDLDGVVDGDYGKDALPWDFNRAWELLPMRPEVHALQQDLQRFAGATEPRVVIDLHAPVHWTPGLFHHMPRDQRPLEQTKVALSFARFTREQFPELDPDSIARPTRYASRWNALSMLGSWTWDYLDKTLEMTVETSYQRVAGKVLQREDYHDFGRRVLMATMGWLDEQMGGDGA